MYPRILHLYFTMVLGFWNIQHTDFETNISIYLISENVCYSPDRILQKTQQLFRCLFGKELVFQSRFYVYFWFRWKSELTIKSCFRPSTVICTDHWVPKVILFTLNSCFFTAFLKTVFETSFDTSFQ